MSQVRDFGRKLIRGIFRFILVILLLLILLLGSVIIAIQFPSIQTKLVNKASTYLSKKINFPIYVEGVDIHWFDEIVLEGVTVYDPWKNKMVYIEEAIVDLEVISLTKGKVNVEKITLSEGEVKMIRYSPDGSNNLADFVEALQNLAPPRKKGQKPVPFEIQEVELVNMSFSYDDKRKPYLNDMFDHNHFNLDSIYADVSKLRVVADTFQIDVKSLTTIDKGTKLKVHELMTLFTLTKYNMTLDNLSASIGNSLVKDYLRFNYKNINELSDFNDKIDIVAHLSACKVDFNDLEKFAIELKPYKEKVMISANANGKVTNFKVESLDMAFGNSSKIRGSVSFNGLPDFFETFIEFKFKNTQINTRDLFQYIDSKDAVKVLNKFGTIYGSGTFTGFPQDFVTNGSFSTGIGKLKSDIRLNAKRENAKPEYSGRLITEAFNLGKLIDYPKEVQFIDMDGTIKGAGFHLNDAEVTLNSSIKRIGILNYNYKNIKTNAKLSNRTFNGFISIQDTNLVFEANGIMDLTEDKEKFDIKAHLEKANLKPLGFSNVETLVKTDLDLDFIGTDIDNIAGSADFKNTYLLFNNEKEIAIDSLYAYSLIKGDERTIEVQSNLLSLKAEGNFKISTLYNDAMRLYEEYELTIQNNSISIEKYYASKNRIHLSSPYKLDFDINIKNLNSIFEFYAPGLYLSKGLLLTGSFRHGLNSILNFNTHIDTLFYKGNEILKTDIEVSTSKMEDNSDILAMFFVNSEKQKINELPPTKNLVIEGIWDKGKINFITNIDQENSKNKIRLDGSLSLLNNSKKLLAINDAEFNILNQNWYVSPDNSILFANKEITFENLKLFNNEQFIQLDGTISDFDEKEAFLKIGNFKLNILNSLIPGYSLNGTLNANVTIKDLYKDLNLEGEMDIEKLAIDNFILGNIKGNSLWDNLDRKLLLDIALEREENATIDLKGYILPQTSSSEEKMDLRATLKEADLKILSPIVKGVLSDLSGKVTGELKILGSIKKPEITGSAFVNNGKFKIDYLGTTYSFNDTIFMEPNNIGFKRMRIRDEFGNRGIIEGGIAHDRFTDFIVDISGKMTNLNVLNTTEKDNELFYGDAFVTGDFSILGPFSDLSISANATSKKGTRIFIPVSSAESTEKQSFITFTDKKTKGAVVVKDTLDLSGINLEFNFELTPDAYAEIIFDKRTGDIISGKGNGNIKMTIDTRGEFNMYGNYQITEGNYHYSLAGLISREFKIEPNSSITWSGDPYGGILDVQAFFENKVSIAPLIEDSIRRQQEVGRTHPTKVLLDIKGELLSPQISLDIDIIPNTAVANEVSTDFESTIKRNEQLLNKQVFSLLVLGNFSPENSFTGTGGSASNVSQLLTNQLGNWLSQVDENLIIDIDLNSLDKDALNTFNLRLSYTLLDGRLRISRDGSFTNLQNNPNSQQSLSNIAGEWTVEYLLSKEGKFRLKLYNKNNQNQLMNNFTNINYTSAGFSLLHTQSFNNLNELLGGKKKKNKQKDTSPTKSDAILPDKKSN